jgi:hypothetical protein
MIYSSYDSTLDDLGLRLLCGSNRERIALIVEHLNNKKHRGSYPVSHFPLDFKN